MPLVKPCLGQSNHLGGLYSVINRCPKETQSLCYLRKSVLKSFLKNFTFKFIFNAKLNSSALNLTVIPVTPLELLIVCVQTRS